MKKVTVLGAGSWGITLAQVLAEKGFQTTLWEFDPVVAAGLNESRELPGKLPGVKLSDAIKITSSLADSVKGAELVLFVVPSITLRATCEQLRKLPLDSVEYWVCASKGLASPGFLRMSQVVAQGLGRFSTAPFCALSGPSHAEEVSRRLPTSIVASSHDKEAAEVVQDAFMTSYLRVYTNNDVVGVELGGAIKNIMAIAAGIADGLEMGDNSKAALITRGLAEMTRLGCRMGARSETFSGLTGLGDLVVTCASRHSRNRRLGELLGQGMALDEALAEIGMVVEGVETTRVAYGLQEKVGVEMPITREVYRVLFEGKSPRQAVAELMKREARSEIELHN